MTQKLFLQDESYKLWNFRAGKDLRGPKVQALHFIGEDIEVLLISRMIYQAVVK